MQEDNQSKLRDNIRRGTEETVRAGKTSTKIIAKSSKKIIGGISIATGISAVQIIALLVVLAIIIGIIMTFLSFMRDNHYLPEVRLTDEGTEIINTFNVYTEDLYQYSGETINDSYRFGVPWENTTSHATSTVHDDDDNREHYKEIMDKIKENHYEFMLCSLWKTFNEISIEVMSDYGTYPSNNANDTSLYLLLDSTRTNPQSVYFGAERPNPNTQSYDAWYYCFVTCYMRCEHGTYNNIYGFQLDVDDADILTSDTVHFNNPFFVKETFKACLDAFVDDNGNFIDSLSRVNAEILDENSNGTTPTATIASSSSATGPTANNTSQLSADISAAVYGNKLADKVINNYIRGLKNHFNPGQRPEAMSKQNIIESNINCYGSVQSYYNHINNLTEADYNTDAKRTRHRNNTNNMLKERISEKAASFLQYTMVGAGDAAALVQLAHQQVGNGGRFYCESMGMGLTEWCAIYAGWLLREGGGVNLDDYGWAANVGVWCDALDAKGVFHLRGTYVPSPGDIVIFGSRGNRYHVGVVIDVGGGNITTSEGNTNGTNMSNSSVGEHVYSLDSSVIYGYGQVTYQGAQAGSGAGTEIGGGSVSIAVPKDSAYKSVKYTLTARQRRIIEETVSGEYGNDPTGAALIAQCCRDALVYGFVDKAENLPSKAGYDGYYAWGGKEPTQIAKNAVKNIFDNGGYVVKHRILVMYNPTMCSSSWHEARRYVCTYGTVRFFDFWEGEHF